jgi:Flp pilus assembly pilin Flp
MKSIVARLIADQSGAISFEDGLTIVSLTIGFAAAFALMNGTIIQLFAAVFGLLPG